MTKSLPNLLTWTRVVLAPVIAVIYFLGQWGALAALFIYIIAAVTDYLDGKIARDHAGENAFGVFLDPVADKILVICVLMVLVADPSPVVDRLILAGLAAVIILREVVQSALRDWMAQMGKTTDVAVTALSKAKTVLQMVALGVLLSHPSVEWLSKESLLGKALTAWTGWIGVGLLALAALLSVITLVGFLRSAFSAPAAPAVPEE